MTVRGMVSSVAESAFARQAAGNVLKLSGLYSLYALWFTFAFHAGMPYLERLILTGAGATFQMAILAGAAVFVAAADHFDVFAEREPETRRRDWGCLALFAVAACLLMELGLPLADRLLDTVVEAREAATEAPWTSTMKRLVPVAVAAFVVASGVAGAAVGRKTERSSPGRRLLVRWLSALGFTALFAGSLVLWTEVVITAALPFALIPLVPPLAPLAAACWLVRSQRYGVLEVMGLKRYGNLAPEALDRIVQAVVDEGKEGALSVEEAARTLEELEMARFLKWFREVAGPVVAARKAEEEEAAAIALKTASAPATKRTPRRAWRQAWSNIGEFGFSWAVLSGGLAAAGLPGGLMPRLAPALAVGGFGAAVGMFQRRRGARA